MNPLEKVDALLAEAGPRWMRAVWTGDVEHEPALYEELDRLLDLRWRLTHGWPER